MHSSIIPGFLGRQLLQWLQWHLAFLVLWLRRNDSYVMALSLPGFLIAAVISPLWPLDSLVIHWKDGLHWPLLTGT